MSREPTPIILGPQAIPAEDSSTSDLQQVMGRVMNVLSRRRYLFLLPLLTGMMVSLTIGLFLPRRYFMTTLFERRYDEVVTNLVNKNATYSFEQIRRTLNVDIRGHAAIAAAVDQLDLTADFPKDASGTLTTEGKGMRQALIASLMNDVKVGLRETSESLDLIEIRYLGDKPAIGGKVISQLKNHYIAATCQRVNDILNGSLEFYSKEADKKRQAAVALENELIQLNTKHPGLERPELLDEQLVQVGRDLQSLEQQTQKLQTNIAARQEYLNQLGDRCVTATQPADTADPGELNLVLNPKHKRIVTEIDDTRRKIADAKSIRRMTDLHPEVVALRRQLENLQQSLEEQPEYISLSTAGANAYVSPLSGDPVDPWAPTRARASMELKSLQQEMKQARQRIVELGEERKRLEAEKKTLYALRPEYALLREKLDNARNDLRVWKGNIDEIQRILTAEADNRGIRFASLQEPYYPGSLASPTITGVFLLSIGVGLALGISLVFLREVLDRSLRNPSRVSQNLGISVLETIGEIQIGRPAGWYVRHRLLPAVASLQAVGVLALGTLVYLSLEKPSLYHTLVDQSAQWLPG